METVALPTGVAGQPDLDKLKVKTACCPACGGWVLQSAFPWCETNKESQKEWRACIKAGLAIDVVTLREAHKLVYCPTQGDCKPLDLAAATPATEEGSRP